MNRLFELGDSYAKESSWKDFALVKLCLFSMGLAVGANAAQKHRGMITVLSIIAFVATYVPLMSKFMRIAAKNSD